MKKRFSVAAIVAALLVCVCAQSCSKDSGKASENKAASQTTVEETSVAEETSTADEEVNDETEEPVAEKNSDVSVELLHCVFTDELTATDKECINQYYTKQDGYVYVDLALDVVNNSNTNFGSNNISGYFMYDDLRYDMSFAYEKDSNTSVEIVTNLPLLSQSIAPHSAGTVHLVTSVEEAVKNTPITVYYTVNGVEYTKNVSSASTDVMAGKTKLTVGSTVNVNDYYDVEVISCKTKDYLSAVDSANSSQYQPTDDSKKFFELVLKIKNNSNYDLKELYAYSKINGELVLANVDIEGKELLSDSIALISLGGFTNHIIVGEEKYVHIYTYVDKNASTSGLAMRFNLGNMKFYCPIQE